MGAKLWSKESGAVGFSSSVQTWSTPQDFYDRLHKEFNFTLDPCASHQDAKCAKYYTVEDDGLKQNWQGETVFMNPPYGRDIKTWIKKAFTEAKKPNTVVVCLVPSRTDTRYWHEYIMKATEVRLIKGRLKFGDSKNAAPFPSAVVIFDNQSGWMKPVLSGG